MLIRSITVSGFPIITSECPIIAAFSVSGSVLTYCHPPTAGEFLPDGTPQELAVSDAEVSSSVTAGLALRGIGTKDYNPEASVGLPGIPAAVAAFRVLMETLLVGFLLNPTGIFESGHDEVPLCVDIRTDVVGDLAGRMTQPHPGVEGSRTDPDRASSVPALVLPETDMMALARTVPDGLLEGEVLFAAVEKERAYRRVDVGMAKDGIDGDAQAAVQGDRIRRVPAGGFHRHEELGLLALDGDIDWIARMTVGRVGDAWRVGGMAPIVALPEARNQQIGSDRPDRQNDGNPEEGVNHPLPLTVAWRLGNVQAASIAFPKESAP